MTERNIEVPENKKINATSLAGHMLVAMPSFHGEIFEQSVILMFEHSEKGAMGVIVNHLSDASGEELIKQLKVDSVVVDVSDINIYVGGPVETGRGFVVHTDDYKKNSTSSICEGVSVTATIDVVRDILMGQGPEKFLFVLGYAGWGPSQLDKELRANTWLYAPVDSGILFDATDDDKWSLTLKKVGVDNPIAVSHDAGYA